MQGTKRFLAVVAACLAAPAAASAQIGAPVTVGACPQGASGTTCDIWTGKVTFIGDADTMSVDLAGDGTKKPIRVRITGINAAEERYYTNVPKDRRGDCHANEATARLEALVKASKGRVRLAAQNPESTSRGRWKRAVSVRIHSRWRDVGRTLVKEGHALWLPSFGEWAYNRIYSTLSQQAQMQQVGTWAPEYCRPGPPANVRIWANADPEGGDDVDGEWVRLRNLDPINPLALGGWMVRDSGLRGYVFPPGTTIAPAGEITLWIGQGTDTPS